MGIILQKIGARTMPLGSPESEKSEEEDREQDEEREEDKRQRYLHSSLEECSDTEYWTSLHHHYEAGDSDDSMPWKLMRSQKKNMVHLISIGLQPIPIREWTMKEKFWNIGEEW